MERTSVHIIEEMLNNLLKSQESKLIVVDLIPDISKNLEAYWNQLQIRHSSHNSELLFFLNQMIKHLSYPRHMTFDY